MLVTWALAGLIAGCLGRLVLRMGGYGLIADLLLGVAGAIVGDAIFGRSRFPRSRGAPPCSASPLSALPA